MFLSQILSILILFFIGFFPNLTNVNFPTWIVVILMFFALLLFIAPIIKDLKRISGSIKEHQSKSSSASSDDHEALLVFKKSYRKMILFLVLSIVFFIAISIIISMLNEKSEKLNLQMERMKQTQIN